VLPTGGTPVLQSSGGVTCLTIPTPGAATSVVTGSGSGPTGASPGATPGATAGTTAGMTTHAATKCIGDTSTVAKKDTLG
jgi:hypothetical protein